MKEGKTRSGFEFQISTRLGGDWRLVKALAMTESKDESEMLTGWTRLVTLIFRDQEDALYEHLMEEDGYIETEKIMEAVTDALEVLGGKNSSSSPE